MFFILDITANEFPRKVWKSFPSLTEVDENKEYWDKIIIFSKSN